MVLIWYFCNTNVMQLVICGKNIYNAGAALKKARLHNPCSKIHVTGF